METFLNLDVLEVKIEKVAALCESLRYENNLLREQLAASETQREELAQRMREASSRLSALMERLPES
jgi:cell division protein ZapB